MRSRAPKFNGCAFECPGRQLPARSAVRRQFSASSFRSPAVLHHQRFLLESRSRRRAVLREVGVEDGGFAFAGIFLEPLTAKCQTPLTWCNIRTTMKSTFPWSQRRYLLIQLRSPVRWRTTRAPDMQQIAARFTRTRVSSFSIAPCSSPVSAIVTITCKCVTGLSCHK